MQYDKNTFFAVYRPALIKLFLLSVLKRKPMYNYVDQSQLGSVKAIQPIHKQLRVLIMIKDSRDLFMIQRQYNKCQLYYKHSRRISLLLLEIHCYILLVLVI